MRKIKINKPISRWEGAANHRRKMLFVKHAIALIVSFFFIIHATSNLSADPTRTIDFWKNSLPFESLHSQPIKIGEQPFSSSREILLESGSPIFGLTISGSTDLKSEKSLVRIILVDDRNIEFLVYESYPLIANGKSVTFDEACEETCLLNGVRPSRIKIQLHESSIHIRKINICMKNPVSHDNLEHIRKQIKIIQDKNRIHSINETIKKRGLRWKAGETSVSKLSYSDKQMLFTSQQFPNLQGAEYYKGGIFEVKSLWDSTKEELGLASASSVESFDWRSVHGADNPSSPYYDGDPLGSGWMTPVKSQISQDSQNCGHCWAFAPLHATEALTNLYFNQHLDLDLSEQDVASCSGGEVLGCCNGGYSLYALNYIASHGVVNESCFPYSFYCTSCTEKCSNPSNQIRIAGTRNPAYHSEESFKREIIANGPITAGLLSWGHEMVLVGFAKDPKDRKTIWKFKNSFGPDWGDNGYAYLKVNFRDFDINAVHVLLNPVTSLVKQFEVLCRDEDGDGFYNWGISNVKPASCPPESASEKDCDDFNPLYGPMDSNGNCTIIGQGYTLTINNAGAVSGTVTSNPPGIHCGKHCSRLFGKNLLVVLTATPNTGFTVVGWNGCESVSENTCTITMTTNKLATPVLIEEAPTYHGTVGTQFTIKGSGFGNKKGRVLIGTAAAKIGQSNWTATEITCTVKNIPKADAYPSTFSVEIKPAAADPILVSNATFTVMPPKITGLSATQGTPGTPVTINGLFFGTKKGKVYLEYADSKGNIRKKNCKVTKWAMDQITFLVPRAPKGLAANSPFSLKLKNKVGIASSPEDFNIY